MKEALQRLRRLSRRMQHAILAIAAISAVVTGYVAISALVDPVWLSAILSGQFGNGATLPIGSAGAVAVVAFMLCQATTFGLALYALWRAFGQVAGRDHVDHVAALWMSRAGSAFLATSVLMILARPAISAIISLDAPPGHRFLSLGIGTSELMSLLVSAVLTLVARIMTVTAELAEDNRQIV